MEFDEIFDRFMKVMLALGLTAVVVLIGSFAVHTFKAVFLQ